MPTSDPLTPFGRLWSTTNPLQHVISNVHNTLWADKQADAGKYCKTWTQDLELDLTEENWELIHCHVHKGSINISTQENNYKILSC